MTDNTGFNTPDDEGAENALTDVEEIITAAAAQLDQNNDGVIDAEELAAVEAAEEAEAGAEASLSQAQDKAAEHLADLQRLQAEFANYRKRVDRDRDLASALATARAIEALIPVLDDIAAARDHGDLEEGPFAAIAEKLESTLAKFGWSSYGAPGDAFDPALHEALLTQTNAAVKAPQIETVAQPGHRLGDKILRPARVVVVQPE
jgi:molecular chaperone GrpE